MADWRAVAASVGPLEARRWRRRGPTGLGLTKPAGSLGRLEELAVQIPGIQGRALPRLEQRTIVVMAADHGVAARGVSAYPPAVTGQMVANFVAGGAAINVLARQLAARLVVVDVGVAHPLPLGEPDGNRSGVPPALAGAGDGRSFARPSDEHGASRGGDRRWDGDCG